MDIPHQLASLSIEALNVTELVFKVESFDGARIVITGYGIVTFHSVVILLIDWSAV